MQLNQLLQPWLKIANNNCAITGIQNDSRAIIAGDLFLAYPGMNTDGRLFIQQALESGASAVIYESNSLPKNFCIVDTIYCIPMAGLTENIAAIAKRFYHVSSQVSKPQIIGVTGTNGKTTVALQLAQAYELLGDTAAYIGTLGYGKINNLSSSKNTTPDALLLQKLFFEYTQAKIKYICMEVSSHALQQQRVTNIEFKQAIFTNLTQDHLDYHQNMQNYAAAKARLFMYSSLQYAILNRDDAYFIFIKDHIASTCKIITYGMKKNADVYIQSWQMLNYVMQIQIYTPWGIYNTQVNFLGKFNLYNIMAVLISLVNSGYKPEQVISILPQLKSASGRMEIVRQEPLVIVDYAHSPDALANVLLTVQQLKLGKILLVFGCGGERDHGKRPIMGKIASQYADVVILTSDNPRHEDPEQIIADIAVGITNVTKIYKIINREQAVAKAIALATKYDIVIIAGKGHEQYQQIGDEYLSFSDQEIINKIQLPRM